MADIHQMLPSARAYVAKHDWESRMGFDLHEAAVAPLAQGEYNLNYKVSAPAVTLVLRVNVGTQIDRTDQIRYEYKALQLLADSGVTPRPYYVDDSRRDFDTGVLFMAYLPGGPLDYARDLDQAADLFARIHQVPVPASSNHLIREEAPLSLIYEECHGLLETYFASDLADPEIRHYLGEVRHWAAENRATERYYQADPWNCIVNTEVNSGNFIANRDRGSLHLVDWEMPRYGDPTQDLAHFCSPLTTLWKTDYRMRAADKARFIAAYTDHLNDAHLRDTLIERLRLREPYVLLRGISWSAMGWVAYQGDYAGVRNPDTWATLQRYLQLNFIRTLFDPIIR
ncbi:MAG: phosphotransferase [Desulfosarcinaceae bacterium]|nr:phosphotransferase [Desulfosarcinaceae bacterium]